MHLNIAVRFRNSTQLHRPFYVYQCGEANDFAYFGQPSRVCDVPRRLTSEAETLSGLIDEACNVSFFNIWEAKVKVAASSAAKKRRVLDGEGEAANARPHVPDDSDKIGVFPGSVSVAFLGGTIERVRERCAGDCHAVRQTKAVQRLPGLSEDTIRKDLNHLNTAEQALAAKPGMQGRIWYGQGLIYDEVYQFLQDISILDKPADKKSSEGAGAGQTPLAGWFNRLVQSGKSDHETKCNGSHGGLACLPVSLSMLGNFHPTPAIEMIRGERGDHGCQSKARLIVVTGLPVQPHEQFEAIGGVECVVDWVPVPLEVQSIIGLEECTSANAFQHFFAAAGIPEPNGEDAAAEVLEPVDMDDVDPPIHIPDPRGYEHTLPDNVQTRVRMHYVSGRYRLEWQLPNRMMVIPVDKDVALRMKDFIKHGAQTPHRKITLAAEARGAFLSFQTMYNIKVKQARDANDADAGAEWGIAPWKLGQLSAALLLWDIMWGAKTPTPKFKEEPWEVELQHVERAYKLMSILDGVREGFRTNRIREAELVAGIPEALAAKNGEDRDIPNCPSLSGTWGTEISRRMLFKSAPTDIAGEYKCHSVKTFQLFTKKEQAKVGKMTVYMFRDIAKACPPVLGRFDEGQDSLLWKLPDDPSAEWKSALLEYANTAAHPLRNSLKMGGLRQRKGQSAAE